MRTYRNRNNDSNCSPTPKSGPDLQSDISGCLSSHLVSSETQHIFPGQDRLPLSAMQTTPTPLDANDQNASSTSSTLNSMPQHLKARTKQHNSEDGLSELSKLTEDEARVFLKLVKLFKHSSP